MTTHTHALAAVALLAGLSGAAQAALIDRGGGLIYDTTLNVTWLQDANYAQTSGYDADGKMNFFDAKTWASNLSYYDSVRGVTYDDWRLPKWNNLASLGGCDWGIDCGYNVDPASGEMLHLFSVELGNTAAATTYPGFPSTTVYNSGTKGVDWGLVNTGPFINLQPNNYWTGSQFGYNIAFYFDFGSGYQNYWYTTSEYYALAVRNGDVAAVPEADTWVMLLAGLGLVGAATRRKQRETSDLSA